MANNITGNPWTLDSVGATLTSKIKIKNIIWINGAGSLLIQDNIGRDLIRDVWSASTDHNYGELSWVAGLHVVTIGGGEVVITVQK